jgi:hypothetical protein
MKIDTHPRIIAAVLTIIYSALIYGVYINFISPRFEYMQYIVVDRPFYQPMIGISLSLVPIVWMPIRLQRPSEFVWLYLFVIVFVPYVTIGPVATMLQWPLFLAAAGLIALGLGILRGFSRLPLLRLPTLHVPRWCFWGCYAAFCLFLVMSVINALGIPNHIPSLTDVYDVRFNYRESTSTVSAYSILWLGKIFGPFLIAFGLTRRRAIPFTCGLGIQMFVFAMSGWKSVFFAVVIIAAALLTVSRFRRRGGLAVLTGAIALVGVSLAVDLSMDQHVLSSMFFRRLIATPGMLTAHYLEFFSTNPHLVLSHSILSGVSSYQYDVSPPLTIGWEVFGRAEMAANANVWADAFANFGLAGMLVYSVLLGALLWIFDSVAHRHGLVFGTAVLSLSAFSLSDTAVFTVVMTHGLGIAIVALYFLSSHRCYVVGSRSTSDVRC